MRECVDAWVIYLTSEQVTPQRGIYTRAGSGVHKERQRRRHTQRGGYNWRSLGVHTKVRYIRRLGIHEG